MPISHRVVTLLQFVIIPAHPGQCKPPVGTKCRSATMEGLPHHHREISAPHFRLLPPARHYPPTAFGVDRRGDHTVATYIANAEWLSHFAQPQSRATRTSCSAALASCISSSTRSASSAPSSKYSSGSSIDSITSRSLRTSVSTFEGADRRAQPGPP